MNVICCVLTYSAGMPLLYLVGAAYCGVSFWVDKCVLLRGSRRPPCYSEDTVKRALHLFPFAAFLHTLFGLNVLGNRLLFPSDWSILRESSHGPMFVSMEEYDATMLLWDSANEAEKEGLYMRYLHARTLDFTRKGCWLLMVFFFIGVCWYLAYYAYKFILEPVLEPLVFLLKEVVKACCLSAKHVLSPKAESVVTETGTVEWKDAQEQAKLKGKPVDYAMGANLTFQPAYEAIKHTDDFVAALDAKARQQAKSIRTATGQSQASSGLRSITSDSEAGRKDPARMS